MATTNTGRASRAAEPAVRVAGDWRPALNLTLATLGFAVCFWAWALLGPLAPGIKERLGLSFAEQSLVVAVPVIVGSLGRIPVGALTDRFGARLMLPAVSLATVVPVLVLAYTQTSYAGLIVAGFFLGIGGTAVPLADASGAKAPFFLVAAVLVGYAVLALALIRDAHPPGVGASALRRTAAASRLAVTWQLCFLYAVGFGGFVAFSVYLPAYLRTAYQLRPADAALRTAGFVVVAVVARPIGGWLSDRLHPVPVLVTCFSGVAGLAVLQAFQPALIPWATVALLGMAGLLGAAAGGVFALVGKVAPAGQVGAVTGLVGAAGGLGGFVPPLVMGWVYGVEHSYSIGLMLLSDIALAAAVYTAVKMAGLARSSDR